MAMTKPRKLYPMKEACKQTGMSYETLKYYCNTGLIPNVKRSSNNRRVFDIPIRKIMLKRKLAILEEKKKEIQESINYIGWKQNFYDEVLSGKRPYISDLLPEYNDDADDT